jgi:hypothetical protein
MSLNTNAIMDQLVSHAEVTGYFDSVNKHEPKSAPGNNIVASVTLESIAPYAARSGLAATAARVTFTVRIYNNMLQEPQDDIDPNIADAADGLFIAYMADFDLGGTASNVDIFGASGQGLAALAGYLKLDTNITYRVITITVPVIVNDVWVQVA